MKARGEIKVKKMEWYSRPDFSFYLYQDFPPCYNLNKMKLFSSHIVPLKSRSLYYFYLFILIYIFGGIIAFLEICFSELFARGLPFFIRNFEQGEYSVLAILFRTKIFRLNLSLFWTLSGIAAVCLLPLTFWSRTRKYLKDSPLFACLGILLLILFSLLIYFSQFFQISIFKVRIFCGIILGFFLTSWILGFYFISRFTRFAFLEIRIVFFSALGFFISLILVRNFLLKLNFSFLPILKFFIFTEISLISGFLLGVSFSWLAGKVRFWWRLEMGIAFVLFMLGIYNLSLPMREWLHIYYPQKPKDASLLHLSDKSSNLKQVRISKSTFPNILLIVLDTTRADHLSLYGYYRKTTPFLDWLGARSVVFERAYSSAPHTISSHASIFTGLLPGEHHCTYQSLFLEQHFLTLAERLYNLGYITMGYSNNTTLSRLSGLTQGFETFYLHTGLGLFSGEIFRWLWLLKFHPQMLKDSGAKLTDITLKKWLWRLKERDRPFFLFINYMEAHYPLPLVKKSFRFFPDGKKPAYYNPFQVDYAKFNCLKSVSPKLREAIINHYDGAIYYLDHMLSKLYTTLAKFGYLDNTIIIIVGDHGEMFSEHHQFWGHKYYLYEPLIRVPFLIYYPRLLKPARIPAPVSLIEIPQMVNDLIQGRVPKQIAHPQFKPLLAEVYRPYLWVEEWQNHGCSPSQIDELLKEQKAVISWPYKLIWDEQGKDELFDLSQDPQEKINLKNQKLQTYAQLSSIVDIYRAQIRSEKKKKPIVDVSTLNALRTLGYLR